MKNKKRISYSENKSNMLSCWKYRFESLKNIKSSDPPKVTKKLLGNLSENSQKSTEILTDPEKKTRCLTMTNMIRTKEKCTPKNWNNCGYTWFYFMSSQLLVWLWMTIKTHFLLLKPELVWKQIRQVYQHILLTLDPSKFVSTGKVMLGDSVFFSV